MAWKTFDQEGALLVNADTGGGGVINGPFVLSTTDPNFPDGRVLDGTVDIGVTDNGAGTTITVSLEDTTVTPGTYGDTLNVATVTVDQKGRLTTVLNTPIDLIIQDTYSNVTTLMSADGLQESATYYLTDKFVFLTATSNNSLSTAGIVKAFNPDWQNVTGNFLGVWTLTLGGVALNKICVWFNLMYVNITGSNGATNPIIDTVNWTVIPISSIDYQIEYDPIIYDFPNDIIIQRACKRGNLVSEQNGFAVANFQWGRDTTSNNKIFSTNFECCNAVNRQDFMFIQDSGGFVRDTANARFAVVEGRSSIEIDGDATCQAIKAFQSNIMMSTGNGNALNMFGSNITIASGSGVCARSIFNYANITLTGTSDITNSYISGGSTSITKSFASENHLNRVYIRDDYSTFETTLTQASGSTTITLGADLFYGLYSVTVTGGAGSVDTIANMPGIMPISILMVGSNDLTIVNNPSILCKGATSKTLTVAAQDWIELQQFNGTTKEINCSIGTSGVGVGTVTSVSVVTNQGVSGSVATATTTPAITLSLGALTGATSYNGLVITANTGTVTTGIWNGTPVDETHGGTNQSTYTTGQILYASAANTLSKLAIGSSGQVLTVTAGVPSWATPASGSVTSVSGTANRITSTGGTTPVIDIASTYVGQTSIATLGTITTGSWTATKVGLAYGGTNADLSATGGAANYLKQSSSGAAITVGTIPASDIGGAALTKTDDTNVTMTLGGTPSTSLLVAASMTLGWTGTLSGARGGTGVANTGFTITLAGNLVTTGAFNTTFSASATATYTLPTATSTLLANNLGLSAGTILIGSTATNSGIEFRTTSNSGGTTGANFTWTSGNNGATQLMQLTNAGNLGIGLTPVNILDISKSANAGTIGKILNANAGTSAYAVMYISNGTSNFGLYQAGSGFSSTGQYFANGSTIESDGVGGLSISALNSGSIRTYTGSSPVLRHTITNVGLSTWVATYHVLAAGTGTAGQSALKFTAGTALTTPEAGAIDYATGVFSIQNDVLIIGGKTLIGTESLSVQKNQNAFTGIVIQNTTAGTAARAQIGVIASGAVGTYINAISASYTTSGVFIAGSSLIYSDMPSGINIATTTSSAVSFYTNSALRWNISSSGILSGDYDFKLTTAGKTIYLKEGGAAATSGQAQMVAGTLLINTTSALTNSRIHVTDAGGGVLANIGALYIAAIVNGVSFTVTSSNPLDTSFFNWFIIQPS